jgi:hypothetical protein
VGQLPRDKVSKVSNRHHCGERKRWTRERNQGHSRKRMSRLSLRCATP